MHLLILLIYLYAGGDIMPNIIKELEEQAIKTIEHGGPHLVHTGIHELQEPIMDFASDKIKESQETASDFLDWIGDFFS